MASASFNLRFSSSSCFILGSTLARFPLRVVSAWLIQGLPPPIQGVGMNLVLFSNLYAIATQLPFLENLKLLLWGKPLWPSVMFRDQLDAHTSYLLLYKFIILYRSVQLTPFKT